MGTTRPGLLICQSAACVLLAMSTSTKPQQRPVWADTGSSFIQLETSVAVSYEGSRRPEYPGQLSSLEIVVPSTLAVPCAEQINSVVLVSRNTEGGRFGAGIVLAFVLDRMQSSDRHESIVYNMPTSVSPADRGGIRYSSSELTPQGMQALRERLLLRSMSSEKRNARAYVGVVWFGKAAERFYPIEIAHRCPN